MSNLFAKTLKKLRAERRLSQCELARWTYVNRSTVARWESGNHFPNAAMMSRLAACLSVNVGVLPSAAFAGFSSPSQTVGYARANRVVLAFLDIELGNASGLDLCRTLLDVNPRTNVVFLTAYAEYSLDAWSTKASGFMVKPITAEGVCEQLGRLRYPFAMGGVGA